MNRVAVSIALAMAMAGCATTSYELPTGKPIAYITVNRAELGMRLGSIQDAKIYHRGPHTGSTISSDVPWNAIADYVYDTRLPVEAEVPSVIMIDLRTSMANWTAYCDMNFAFTPKAGRTYRFTPRGTGEEICDTAIIDIDTGAPPEDLLRIAPVR